jgi:hypothetical protein
MFFEGFCMKLPKLEVKPLLGCPRYQQHLRDISETADCSKSFVKYSHHSTSDTASGFSPKDPKFVTAVPLRIHWVLPRLIQFWLWFPLF